jgi:hypothetical protein
MYEFGTFKCVKCGVLVGFVAISVVGEAFQEHHVCRDLESDIGCRKPNDLPSHGPYHPANFNAQVVATTSSTSASSASFVFPSQFK